MRYPLIGDFPFFRPGNLLSRFRRDRRGYAVALTLIALPLIVGVAAWVIDASRITNLHTDLQNATDAMALAGARELDGRNDAITRAKAAIEELNKNEAWFGGSGSGLGAKIDVVYDDSDASASNVHVLFLKGIPASDSTPIDYGTYKAAELQRGQICLGDRKTPECIHAVSDHLSRTGHRPGPGASRGDLHGCSLRRDSDLRLQSV